MRFPFRHWAPAALVAASVLALAATAPRNTDWMTTGGDRGKSHFSALKEIDAGNVARLGFAWGADLGTNRGMEATPIVIGGVMYTSGVSGRVYAHDAATGAELWRFEPEINPNSIRAACCDFVNRGVAVQDGKVFVAALDAMLYALDAKTGKVLWRIDTVEDHGRGITSTGAPEVAGDIVAIGNAGAEYDVRGYVSGYDVNSGRLVWRFHTVPRDPKLGPQDHPDLEPAAKTWDPNSRWDIGGGGASWDAINFDPDTGLLLVGTGNGGPYHVRQRSPNGGDNLYLSSIVALDPKTGRVRWHYQETPGDSWDFTATSPMILTRMTVDGENRPVLMQAPKNGFLYVIDRRDGRLLRATPIVRTNWASGVDLKTGRPNMTPAEADYSVGPRIVFPSTAGAHNWTPGAWNPQTGLVYLTMLDMGNLIFMSPGRKDRLPRVMNNDASLIFTPDVMAALPTLPPEIRAQVEQLPSLAQVKANPGTSALRAIDPLTGKTRWSQPMPGWQDRAGVLATASGLIFQGNLSGQLRIFDARSGKLLKSIETGSSIMAAPMTYKVNGVQYVAITTGWGGGGWPYTPRYAAAYQRSNANRILAFRLDGGPVPLPDSLPALEVAPPPPPQLAGVTPAMIDAGRGLFFRHCAVCHSNQHRSISPDLRRIPAEYHEAFDEIVLRGLLAPNGMPRWDDILREADAHAIHAYLIDLQARTRADEIERKNKGQPLDKPSAAILSSY